MELNKKVYDFLRYMYNLTQNPTPVKGIGFTEYVNKMGLDNKYLTIARKNYFDSSLLKGNAGGLYHWTAPEPTHKMASALIAASRSKGVRRARWTPEDKERLQSLWTEGRSKKEISKELGRTEMAVHLYMSKQGMLEKEQVIDFPENKLTEEHEEQIKYNEKHSISQMNIELQKALTDQEGVSYMLKEKVELGKIEVDKQYLEIEEQKIIIKDKNDKIASLIESKKSLGELPRVAYDDNSPKNSWRIDIPYAMLYVGGVVCILGVGMLIGMLI